jgi:thioredoxin reductase (NADPH)
MYDIAVLGGGPAGLSAAITARARGKSVAVLSNDPAQSGLWRADRVDNYPGLPNVSGKELLELMTQQAKEVGAEIIRARVTGMMDTGEGFMLNAGTDVFEAKTVIIASGVVSAAKFPGEAEYLGMGVSYCATCDGMFYRSKIAAVIGRSADAPEEANALKEMGVDVFYTGMSKDRPEALSDNIPYIPAKKIEITGDTSVTAVVLDGERHEADGVFILRQTVAPTAIFPELEMEGGYIKTDRGMRTSAKGVFAAGDCTGKPLQIAKAVGEGLIAALSAVDYLSGK